jgi:hypothetical protein
MPTSYELTVQDYLNRETARQGVCFHCDTWAVGIDPAAARVQCVACGRFAVHGVDQALLQGFIRIRK